MYKTLSPVAASKKLLLGRVAGQMHGPNLEFRGGGGITFPVEIRAACSLCTLAPWRSRIGRYLHDAGRVPRRRGWFKKN